ncbi:M48 family metalloprotease [Candidatus Poribacteria bacterium]
MRAYSKPILSILCVALFLTLAGSVFAQEKSFKSEYELGFSARNFMVRKYSMVEGELVTRRVQSVWKRVVRVVEKRMGVRYRIDVLDTDSIGAWAYPGGFILLTKGLINMAETDDALAFIIAHELGHQARGHVDRPMEAELEEKYKGIIADREIDGRGFVDEFVSEVTKQKEIEADQFGVLYTSLAGYDVSAAFSILDKVIVSDKTKTHPGKEIRQQKIQKRLAAIVDKLEVFDAGVIFYNTEQYSYAEGAFQNFLSVYPSREVYNNLAATYHQEALTYYNPERDIPTKKSIQIDMDSRAKQIQAGARDALVESEEEFQQAMDEALQAYERGIKQDPEYAISYNNQGCAYDDIGEFDLAVARLRKAVRLRDDYKEAYNNLGVAYIHLEEFQQAVTSLKKAIQLDAGYADAYFNLAMVYGALGESSENISENLILFLKNNSDKRSSLVGIAREKLGMQSQADIGNSHPTGRRDKIKRKTVEEILGPPARSVDVIPAGRETIKVHLYPDKETKLITIGRGGSVSVPGLDTVLCIIASGRLAGSTPEDIQVGDSKEQLLAIYGEPERITEMKGLLHYLYPEKGLLFSLRDRIVYSWVLWFNTERGQAK